MSLSPTIPMIGPDGSVAQIPHDKVQAAVTISGAKPAIKLYKDGVPAYLPLTQLGEAMRNGAMTEGQYQQSLTAPHNKGLFGLGAGIQDSFDTNTASNPNAPALANIISSTVRTIGTPFVHPVDTAKALALQTGLGMSLDPQGTIDANPIVSTGRGVKADYKAGGVPYAGANLLGTTIGQVALGKALSAAAEPVVARMGGIQGASPVTSPEAQARTITSAVNPSQGVRNFIEAVQKHGGDATDYANQNGIGIRGALDYSKAARMAGDKTSAEVHAILDPNSGITAPVSEAYQGALARTPGQGVGRYATLGDINSRLVDINKLTSPAFNAKTEMQTMTAAERLGLAAEHAELADKLHQSLSQATGIPPESIAALREKMGKLYTIADGAEAAHNARMGMESNIDQGTRSVPLTATGLAAEKLNQFLRGGPIRIADKSLRKALQQSTLPATQPIPPPRP